MQIEVKIVFNLRIMELTQRLESTQEISENISERLCSDQIGFLGICGTKYPVKKGPNKIGRDPQTCNVVLNLNSISRQHAVLNVLSSHSFMLMDLDSANKTKLQNKTLDPYIPHPLRNGDTVQFGQVFGIFRLLEDDTDLPMTQALEIPETPAVKKHFSKINHTAIIPESPDVSDKDDSFIAPSQSKDVFRSPKTNFLKSSGKIISIQPVGQKKIDNIYWNSSKKSDSFSVHNNSSIRNESIISVKSSDVSDSKNFYELDTQIPDRNDVNVSIYDANTQIPDQETPSSPNIHSMETQVPVFDNLPGDHKIYTSKEMKIKLFTEDKENDISIFNADTQFCLSETNKPINISNNSSETGKHIASDTSNDLIVFDEIDSQPLLDNFESQALLPSSPILLADGNEFKSPKITSKQDDDELLNIKRKSSKINHLNSSRYCDDFDIVPTQKIPVNSNKNQSEDEVEDIDILPTQIIIKTGYNDDETDCEDELNVKKTSKTSPDDDDITDCEDNFDEIMKNVSQKEGDLKTQFNNTEKCIIKSHSDSNKCSFEDMLTQVIPEVEIQNQSVINFEDMPTQVIEIVPESKLKSKVLNTLKYDFKKPSQSPRRLKKKDSENINTTKNVTKAADQKIPLVADDDEEKYYAATQEIIEDLLTQEEPTDIVSLHETICTSKDKINQSSQREDHTKVENYVSTLSSEKIRDIVGVETKVTELKKYPCGSTHCEGTPKTNTSCKLSNTNLPNGQNILPSKTSKRVKNSMDKSLENIKVTDVSLLKSNVITNPEAGIETFNANEILLKSAVSKKNTLDNSSNPTASSKTNEKEQKLTKSDKKGREKNNSKIKKEDTRTSKDDSKSTKKTTKRDSKSTTNSKNMEKDSKEINIPQAVHDKNERPKRNITKKCITEAINLQETSTDKKKSQSTRQTRSRKKPQEDNNQEIINPESNRKGILKRSSSHTDISDSTVERSKRIKITDNVESSPEKGVRRSRRQRIKKEETTNSFKEKSTVYSISPQSMNSLETKRRTTSPINKCRPATALGLATNAKATSSRKKKTQFVLFTAFPSEEVKRKLENLGAVIVSDVQACTVVLTLQLKRTFKLLCAVGLGKPIVGPQWVQACVDNQVIVDPWLYLIHDEATEKRFHFNLRKSLVSKRNFLKGIYVCSTPSVIPSASEMKLIVECSGGTWSWNPPNPARGSWVVVTSHADKALWPALQKKGAVIVSTEFILGGVLQQHLDIDRHTLV